MKPLSLFGCTLEPLVGYLKALGVFRLVAEQVAPQARLAWAGGVANLYSELDRDKLTNFLLEQYRPTPIVAPWNGGSGFYTGGAEPVEAISDSTSERLAPYRDAIARIRKFLPKSRPEDSAKESLLTRCRAELADDTVPWLDACFVLGDDGPSYFPLLGTGGNDGRLEFTNNFMQRLGEVIPFAASGNATAESKQWLAASLFADTLVELGRSAIGQFDPGGIGGANGTQGSFEAHSRVNPWDFVLMIEGCLMFAGSVSRRLGAHASGRAAFPFSVQSVAVGYGSASAAEETSEGSRAEVWLPVWPRQATLAAAKHLFAEGRAQFGRRQARNAVEFALAASLLGVSTGVTSFARYGFLRRNGLAFLAAPLGRFEVAHRPAARLLNDPRHVEWVDRLRSACRDKDKTPVRYQTALREIDRAIYEFANRSEQGNDCKYLLNVLISVGRAERILSRGLAFCADRYIRPLQGLDPQWLIDAAPLGLEGREFRLAASVASIMAEPRIALGPVRIHLEAVEQDGQWTSWSPGSTSTVWSYSALGENLSAVLLRRLIESDRVGVTGCSLRARLPAALDDIMAFINKETNDDVLSDLLWALIAVNWRSQRFKQRRFRRALRDRFRVEQLPAVPAVFSLVRLALTPLHLNHEPCRNGLQRRWRVERENRTHDMATTPTAEPFVRLSRGDLSAAENSAAQRLWSDGLVPFGWANRGRRRNKKHQSDFQCDPKRLLAGCIFPLSMNALSRLARQALNPPEILS